VEKRKGEEEKNWTNSTGMKVVSPIINIPVETFRREKWRETGGIREKSEEQVKEEEINEKED
jgi:hypothetical protein